MSASTAPPDADAPSGGPADLPDFLLIGAAKAGTTAMFRAIGRHPQAFCSRIKEPRFFALGGQLHDHSGPGSKSRARLVHREEDYRALFAGRPAGTLAGEASTWYLHSPAAPAAASRLVPRARLVAILRHPVERAFSQYLHIRHYGSEPIADFAQAWDAEPERIARGWRPAFYYRQRGLYGGQLDRWLQFFPREQLLITFYEDWIRRPVEVLDATFRHIGLEPLKGAVVTRENVTSRPPRWTWLHNRLQRDTAIRRWAHRRLPPAVRDAVTRSIQTINLKEAPKLDPAVRARLAVTCHDDIERVEAITGRDLSSWKC